MGYKRIVRRGARTSSRTRIGKAWDELTLWFLVQCLQGHWEKNSPKI